MELNETLKITLENGKTQKAKCYKFFQTDMNRELAVHAEVNSKNSSKISDVNTGLGVVTIPKEISKVKDEDVNEALNNFIKHFTLEEIGKEFAKWEKNLEEKKK